MHNSVITVAINHITRMKIMSSNWTDGYQTEINYTYGYYADLSPNFQRFCLLLNGIDCPTPENGTHCELGFGQGISLNVHAASSMGNFYGTDFNPAHAAHANMLASQSEINHHFYDASFEELLKLDLPLFDSISLHGIWSWISHENQHIILKFIRHFLKPNGIVYISYNCLTGWSSNMPIRELFHSHFKFNSTSNNPFQKVKDALDFSEALLNENPAYNQSNPNALQKIQQLRQQNPYYLIHEYFNEHWQCYSFQQIVNTLEEIKLSYAGSSDLTTHLSNIHLSEQHQNFLNQIDHPIFKEQCRDYFLNTQFRRDLFIRGKNTLSPLEVQDRLNQTKFCLLTTPENLPTHISGRLGQFDLLKNICQPIANYFKENQYAIKTLAEIQANLPDLNYKEISDAILILVHLGCLQPCLNHTSEHTIQQSQKLNQFFLKQSQYHNNYMVLSNPFSGIGIPCDQIDQLFYRAYFIENQQTAEALAQYSQKILATSNYTLYNSARELVQDADGIFALLIERAEQFLNTDKIEIAKQLQLFGPSLQN